MSSNTGTVLPSGFDAEGEKKSPVVYSFWAIVVLSFSLIVVRKELGSNALMNRVGIETRRDVAFL